MNKFKFYFILLITTVSLFSCSKNDAVEITPPRAYADQYPIDIAVIEDYLETYYLDMDLTDPNFADKDVVITKIPDGGTQPSIMSYLNASTYPRLKAKIVKLHDVDYTIYYLILREGVGESPCNVDGVLASYRGDYLQRSTTTGSVSTITTTKFEEVKFPQSFFDLSGTIMGWAEIFPQFKTGIDTPNPNGTVTYNDFGAGVMFIPSGLAYYSTGSISIPSYSPLVFSFKLYKMDRLDHDKDGIPSYLEDNGDGYIHDYRNLVQYPTTLDDAVRYADDTDKDGIPDFIDVDDDGDNYTTKIEIKNPATGLPYPFADIPTCTSGKKNYLDATCHP